jgi:hypothetical protein
MNTRSVVSVLMFAVLMAVGSAVLFGQDSQSGHGQAEPPMAGIHWAKGEGPDHSAKPGGGGGSPDLINHGGPIMPTAQTTSIFWGPSWGSTNFAGDKIDGLSAFYAGIGGSTYANTSDEYTGTNGQVTNSINNPPPARPYILDLTAASNGGRTGPILAEVCKVISTPVSNGYYPVYVDLPRGHAGYCAWHSAGSCGGTPVQFAFFFTLDGDAGCDPQSTVSGQSQGLQALANVSGHELSEARTDPRLNAWYDSSGQENADKCAWSFGSPYVTFSNGTNWKIQGNWSNNAYNNQTGYPNLSGQKGCLQTN